MIGQHQKLGVSVLLVVSVAMVYARLFGFDFINLDDDQYVTANPMVLAGLSLEGIVWSFADSASFNWHPITWLSHMLDVQLFGLNAGAHHLTNVLLHMVNSVLLFRLLDSATGRIWPAAAAAALFALHPAHVESVAWVSERKDVLSTMFLLLTMSAYVRHCAEPTPKSLAKVTLWFALGLMSKPMLVTLPFVLLLFDVWPLNRLRLDGADLLTRVFELLKEKALLFLLMLGSIVATIWAQSAGGAMKAGEALTVADRVGNALVSYVRYLGKAVVPVDLAIYYPHPGQWSSVYVFGSAAMLVGISVVVVMLRERRPYLAVGWFWFVGTLVPVVGLVQVGSQSMADRYTYVPFIGLFLAAAWAVAEWSGASKQRGRGVAAVTCILIVVYGFASWQYAGKWADSISIFRHSLEATDRAYPSVVGGGVAPKDAGAPRHNGLYTPYYNLGTAYAEARQFNKARQHFEAAIIANSKFPEVYINMGVVLAQQGDLDGSKRNYERALAVDPGNELAARNLALLRQAMR